MTEPVLKWAGGKRQLLDELYSRFPKSYNHFHEPFFGGGALFFDLEPDDGTINDTNSRLINFYKQVRDRPGEIIEICESFKDPEEPAESNRDFSERNRKGKEIKNYYYQQRELFNCRPHGEDFDPVEEAALLLYLNRTCYNGLYRENSTGGFNVPIGRYANPNWVQKERVRGVSEALTETKIFNRDFEYILNEVQEGDLVYFDPPYEPMSPTASFNDYSAEGFDRDDQERLLGVAKELHEQGVDFILSNSGILYDLYDEAGFYVEIEGATRAINSDGDSRDEVDEIIATNIPPERRRKAGQQGLADF